MTKQKMIVKIAKETSLTQNQVCQITKKIFQYIITELTEKRNVEFRNFGTFKIKTYKQKIGRNPLSPKKTIIIPKHLGVKFKPSKKIKKNISNIIND